MSLPRKHHYLPQFYLRGFSPDRRSLFQIEKATSKSYGCQIRDIAAIRDFHELDGADVDDPYVLEKSLAELESEQANHLKEVLAGGIDGPRSRTGLLQFLSVMRMRVPAVKAHIDRSYESTVRATAKALERAGKLPKAPPGYEDVLRVDNLEISVLNWKCLDVMFRMAASENTLDILYGMRATLFRAPFGTAFITSDQPVALYHPSLAGSPCGVGPATPGVEVSLPLSSSALLRLDHESGKDAERLAVSDEVSEFNRRTVVMAQEYVFAGESVERIASLVALHSRAFAGFKHEDIAAGRGFLQIHRFIPVGPG
jgi:Protein of unknown function (DUF4238)